MSKELGIGVRVWVGWYPDHLLGDGVDPRCQTGLVTGGPLPPGIYKTVNGQTLQSYENMWSVALDSGISTEIVERVLYPIDDDTEQAEEHKTREVEV